MPKAVRLLSVVGVAFLIEARAEARPLKVEEVKGYEAMRKDATILSNLASHLKNKHQQNECKCDPLNCDGGATREQLEGFNNHEDDQSKEYKHKANQDVL